MTTSTDKWVKFAESPINTTLRQRIMGPQLEALISGLYHDKTATRLNSMIDAPELGNKYLLMSFEVIDKPMLDKLAKKAVKKKRK